MRTRTGHTTLCKNITFILCFGLLTGCGGGGSGDSPVTPTPPPATNNAPTLTSASIGTSKNTASVPATPSVTDLDVGDSHSFSIVTQPARGIAAVVGNQLVYTPDSHVTGADNFTFRATDTGGLFVTGTATVTVSPANGAPTATQARITARSGLVSSSPVTPYVSDLDFPETFTFQILTAPTNGTASVTGNRLVYTPNNAFLSGSDSFSYRATDSAGQSVDDTARVRVYENTVAGSTAGLGRCTTASTVNANGTLNLRTNAGSCAFYGEAVTRQTASGVPVTVRYATHRPSNGSLPKAVVVLIAGGNLNPNLTAGDPLTGVIASTGGNFVVRSAQLLAEAGYLTLVLDRPSDRLDVLAQVDAYRVSVDHAVDMLAVLRLVSPDNIPLILAGTSRGAMSVVANNLIAAGIQISSPVTSGNGLFVGIAGTPNLQATYVQRRTHVLWHQDDLCPVSTPANSQNLFNALNAHLPGQGTSATNAIATGGVRVTAASATVTPDICGAFDFHGFLGIEPTVIATEANALDTFIVSLQGNTIPGAAFATVRTTTGGVKQVNLTTLTNDADNDALSYALAHTTTSLGGSVALSGSVVTYTPPVGVVVNASDYFVYVATDGRGGVRAAVVTVTIGS